VPISRREISRPCPDVNRLDRALRPFSVQAERIFILDATVKRIEISARAR